MKRLLLLLLFTSLSFSNYILYIDGTRIEAINQERNWSLLRSRDDFQIVKEICLKIGKSKKCDAIHWIWDQCVFIVNKSFDITDEVIAELERNADL